MAWKQNLEFFILNLLFSISYFVFHILSLCFTAFHGYIFGMFPCSVFFATSMFLSTIPQLICAIACPITTGGNWPAWFCQICGGSDEKLIPQCCHLTQFERQEKWYQYCHLTLKARPVKTDNQCWHECEARNWHQCCHLTQFERQENWYIFCHLVQFEARNWYHCCHLTECVARSWYQFCQQLKNRLPGFPSLLLLLSESHTADWLV